MASGIEGILYDDTAIEMAVEWAYYHLSVIERERLYGLLTDEGLEMEEGEPLGGCLRFAAVLTPSVAAAFRDAGYDG